MQTLKRHIFHEAKEDRKAFGYGDLERAKAEFGPEWTYTGTEELEYQNGERADAIALELTKQAGGRWTAVPTSQEYTKTDFELQRYDGLSIWMHTPGYGFEKQFRFGLHRPRDNGGENGSWVDVYDENNNRLQDPVIGCGVAKSPEQMAKDIVRRMLSQAEKVHDLALLRIKSYEQARLAKAETLVELSQAGGQAVPKVNYSNQQPLYLGGVVMTVGCDGSSVQIAGYVSKAEAIRIASILKGAK